MASQSKKTAIVSLLRNDLRVHDNPLFHYPHTKQHKDVDYLLPLTVVDERVVECSGLPGYERDGPPAKTRLCGFWRTGVFRARFLSETIYDLKDRLRALDSDLLVRFGKPEVIAVNIVKALQESGVEVKTVMMQKDFYSEEIAVERHLAKGLKKLGVSLTFFDTAPLIDVRDLPFAVENTPDVFTPFRKRVETLPHLGRSPLSTPSKADFKPLPPLEPINNLPTASAYGARFDNSDIFEVLPYLFKPLEDSYETKFADPGHTRDDQSAFPYKGGETTALERLQYYFHDGKGEGGLPPVAKYKETRNGLLGHAYSTKLSPFLCLGSISPRLVMKELDDHEREFGSSQNTYWVRFEMLWRDYFLYIARKFGTNLFTLGGFEAVTDPKQARIKTAPGWWKEWNPDAGESDPARKWMVGKTGVPFIDANMTELRETGFMSNRGRQNVASFLCKDLKVDWRIGAEFFESHLIDYESSANYGNWQYVSGVGNDPRASRQFNPVKQGNDYDPLGKYIRTWLPALDNVPTYRIQCPWVLPEADRPKGYPSRPVIEPGSWKPHYSKKGPGKLHGNPNEKVRNGAKAGHAPHQGGASKRGRAGGIPVA